MDSGKIPLRYLLTIRQGEPAYDNVTNQIAPAVTDIVRLKAAPNTKSTCPFYDSRRTDCWMYEQRPMECAALKCWDDAEIRSIYNCRRLTRRHLLTKVEGLWDLVADHQQQCDYSYIAELAAGVRKQSGSQSARAALIELIRFDKSIRDLTVERSHIDGGVLDFLFGRPLSMTIELFKLKLAASGRKVILEPMEGHQNQVCYRRGGILKH